MRIAWVLAGLVALATGCGGQAGQQASTTPISSTSAGSQSSTAPTTTTTTRPETFSATMLPISETQGSNTINVALPQIAGGPRDVRDRFNNGMQTALDDLVSQATDTTIDDGALIGDERSKVTTITPSVVAGVAIFNWYSTGAAHPNNTVATITIAVDTAQPILLADVFTDQQAAAERLTTLATALDNDIEPLGPKSLDTFLNWVPTPAGFHTYVPVIHAMGDYAPITLPWDQISDLLTPRAKSLFIP